MISENHFKLISIFVCSAFGQPQQQQQQQQQAQPNTSLFGQTQNAQAGTSLFGQPSTSTGLFCIEIMS